MPKDHKPFFLIRFMKHNINSKPSTILQLAKNSKRTLKYLKANTDTINTVMSNLVHQSEHGINQQKCSRNVSLLGKEQSLQRIFSQIKIVNLGTKK